MKLFSFLSALLLPLSCLGGSPRSSSSSSSGQSTTLSRFAAEPFPIQADDDVFFKLTAEPRDAIVAVLMTAVGERYGCAMCVQMQPEWDLLARTWQRADPKAGSGVLFATVDFSRGQKAFSSLSLQTAPFILLFPPTKGPGARPGGKPVSYDFSTGPLSAESIHSLIRANFKHAEMPPFKRPTDYAKVGVIGAGLAGAAGVVAIAAPYVVPMLQNRTLWAAVCLVPIFLFTTGQMFNQIRKVPYVVGDGKGGLGYFAAGFQNQYGFESQVVAVIYVILTSATIFLAVRAPRMADAGRQKMAIVVWMCVSVCVYSFLLSLFRIKNRGYPFFLPPF